MEDGAYRETDNKGGGVVILKTVQDEKQAAQKNKPQFCFARIARVYDDGLSLYIGADTTPSTKHYKCNTQCTFFAGQKVYIQKAGGEYVVICPIGDPKM